MDGWLVDASRPRLAGLLPSFCMRPFRIPAHVTTLKVLTISSSSCKRCICGSGEIRLKFAAMNDLFQPIATERTAAYFNRLTLGRDRNARPSPFLCRKNPSTSASQSLIPPVIPV
jgi:hypothetical protein